ncbi:unnamed protein product [Peronospora destructor]|uniref:Uncharacterized protein n=1 Tax=Peronospora destructor TaxID=86335 RepID=A0AAV0UMY9_9STRA|nr:unnamed protein product [Peronospora destructor]
MTLSALVDVKEFRPKRNVLRTIVEDVPRGKGRVCVELARDKETWGHDANVVMLAHNMKHTLLDKDLPSVIFLASPTKEGANVAGWCSGVVHGGQEEEKESQSSTGLRAGDRDKIANHFGLSVD